VSEGAGPPAPDEAPWRERLAEVAETARELSEILDPRAMVSRCVERMRRFLAVRRLLSVTRRGIEPPAYGVDELSSWTQTAERRDTSGYRRLEGGLLEEILDAGAPAYLEDSTVSPDDPAAEYLAGQRSLVAIPVFEHGECVEMIVLTRERPGGFDPERLPERVWLTNALARAAFFSRRLEELGLAHAKLDRDLAYIASLQQALLPHRVPDPPGARVAVYYRPAERSGGDYYDYFPLPEGRWGVLLADVSGHGTATAVLMAITHAIAHLHRDATGDPSRLLDFLNRHLSVRYTQGTYSFVTACHAVYDPVARTLRYALAGHPSPRLRREGRLLELGEARRPPLGLDPRQTYSSAVLDIRPGDDLFLYTDGITEARDGRGGEFGEEGLDEALEEPAGIEESVAALAKRVEEYAAAMRDPDDRTVLGIRFS